MMITNEISDDYEKRMNSMMKTVMIVGEGLGLGVQQMIHLILPPFSPHTVTILSLTFFSFAFHAVFSTFQVRLNFFGMGKDDNTCGRYHWILGWDWMAVTMN